MQAETNVLTPLGTISITPTEASHLHASTRNGSFLNLRGCAYHISAHFYRWTDGSWQLGQEFTEATDSNGRHQRPTNQYERRQSLYIGNRAASESARTKLTEVLTKAVADWTAANQDKLNEAETNHLEDRIESETADLHEAQRKVAEATARIAALQSKLDAHKKAVRS